MDTNVYALERRVQERLAQARAEGETAALLASLGVGRASLVAMAGAALIRLGCLLTRHDRARRRTRRPVPSLS